MLTPPSFPNQTEPEASQLVHAEGERELPASDGMAEWQGHGDESESRGRDGLEPGGTHNLAHGGTKTARTLTREPMRLALDAFISEAMVKLRRAIG